MLFYSTALLLLAFVGSLLQQSFGLAGVVAYELAFFLGLAVFFAVAVEWRPVRELFRLKPLSLNGIIRSIFAGVLAWALAQVLGTLLVFLVERAGGRIPATHELLSQAPFLVALLVGGLLPAVAEEMAFRGYVQWSLGPLGGRAAVLLTGVLFGAMHLTFIRVLPLVVLGLVFSEAARRAGSIFPSMIMHFTNNGILLSLAFFFKPGKPLPGLDPMPMDTPWVTVLVLVTSLIPLSLLAWMLARSFGPDDVKGRAAPAPLPVPSPTPSPTPSPAPSPLEEERQQPAWALLLPLIPAVLLYGLAAWQEWHMVFKR
jgi:membrane protease YdiL (CAAX protease family)